MKYTVVFQQSHVAGSHTNVMTTLKHVETRNGETPYSAAERNGIDSTSICFAFPGHLDPWAPEPVTAAGTLPAKVPPPRVCRSKNCLVTWTCRKCSRECCKHHCCSKKHDGTATCDSCFPGTP